MLLALLLLDLLPPLDDAERFRIDRPQINDILILNRQFASRLVDVHRLTNQGDLQAMRETDRLYAAWDFLRDSKADWFTPMDRRWALFRLRDEIGMEAYAEARMPPFVPLWAFREIGKW